MNSDDEGAEYWEPGEIDILTRKPPNIVGITSPWPDVIDGILADWVGFPPLTSVLHQHRSADLWLWY